MTLDEIIVLDRAIGADEIIAYMTAVKALAEVRFPVGKASTQKASDQGDYQKDDSPMKPDRSP